LLVILFIRNRKFKNNNNDIISDNNDDYKLIFNHGILNLENIPDNLIKFNFILKRKDGEFMNSDLFKDYSKGVLNENLNYGEYLDEQTGILNIVITSNGDKLFVTNTKRIIISDEYDLIKPRISLLKWSKIDSNIENNKIIFINDNVEQFTLELKSGKLRLFPSGRKIKRLFFSLNNKFDNNDQLNAKNFKEKYSKLSNEWKITDVNMFGLNYIKIESNDRNLDLIGENILEKYRIEIIVLLEILINGSYELVRIVSENITGFRDESYEFIQLDDNFPLNESGSEL